MVLFRGSLPQCLLLLLPVALTACAPSQPLNLQSAKSSSGDTYTVEPQVSHAQVLSQISVTCENPSACHPAIAQLVATTNTNGTTVQRCTATLIDDQHMITNTHCLPEDLRRIGAGCQNRISFIFPSVQSVGGQTLGCAEIVNLRSVSTANTQGQLEISAAASLEVRDVALIRLSSTAPRTRLELTREGYTSSSYTVHAIDPQDSLRSIYKTKTCGYTFVADQISSALVAAPIRQTQGVLTNCNLIAGNSGSPIVNPAGRIPALVYASLDPRPGVNAGGIAMSLACLVTSAPGYLAARNTGCGTTGQ